MPEHRQDADLVGLVMSHGPAYSPGLVAERERKLADLDPALATNLLAAAETASFFTRPDPPSNAPVRPDARTYRLRLHHAGRVRVLTIPEPFETPELARLVMLARRALNDRQVGRTAMMTSEELAALQATLPSPHCPVDD